MTFFLGACETSVQVGPTDYDETIDFSSYKSFAWISDQPLTISGERSPRMTPLAETHVKNAIKDTLIGKGYAFQIDPEAADFVVAFTVGSRDKIDVRSFPSSYRGRWGWGGRYYGRDVQTVRYTKGQLAIDIFDVERHQPAWHGWASKEVLDGQEVDIQATINDAVSKILAGFPPG